MYRHQPISLRLIWPERWPHSHGCALVPPAPVMCPRRSAWVFVLGGSGDVLNSSYSSGNAEPTWSPGERGAAFVDFRLSREFPPGISCLRKRRATGLLVWHPAQPNHCLGRTYPHTGEAAKASIGGVDASGYLTLVESNGERR